MLNWFLFVGWLGFSATQFDLVTGRNVRVTFRLIQLIEFTFWLSKLDITGGPV
jgi:hypothetical protein